MAPISGEFRQFRLCKLQWRPAWRWGVHSLCLSDPTLVLFFRLPCNRLVACIDVMFSSGLGSLEEVLKGVGGLANLKVDCRILQELRWLGAGHAAMSGACGGVSAERWSR